MDKSFPKISIVTPVFNQIGFIEKTIQSILGQKYPNLEYIIIDGGSTDGTVEIIKKYAAQLAYWESEPDNGMYFALQKGFEKSTGDIMGWLNSDDLLYHQSLFTVAEVLNLNEEIKWITGLASTIDKTGRVLDILPARRWSKFNYMLKDFRIIQQESTFWKRKLWTQAGSCVNVGYKYAGDLELWARFFLYDKLYSVSAPIGCFRLRAGEQLSSRYFNQYVAEADEILSAMPKTVVDERILKKILSYQQSRFLLKSDSIREKYTRLFDYPGLIKYSFDKQGFVIA